MFLLISNEPIKIAQLQKLSNQSVVNDALVIEMVTILLVKARKILIVWWSKERSNRKKKKMKQIYEHRFRYISKLFRGAKE